MSQSDREHFESYRPQTLAKHTILKNYITAYFQILKQDEERIYYVDGFAGRGTYTADDGSPVPGSPRHALDLIASNPELAAKVRTIFIEQDDKLFAQLEATFQSFYDEHPNVHEPHLANGTFSSEMTAILDSWKKRGVAIAPMFVFVDPCGVDGVDFAVIQRLLQSQRKCEVFLFLNVEGVRRILGLRQNMGETLVRLLGSEARVAELARIVDSASTTSEREEAIIRYYEDLMREYTPGKYVVSFRVEKEERRTTSHCLVHVAQHPRGFAIMKDVMWSVGKTSEGKGGLLFEQASYSTIVMLFRPEWDSIKASVLEELRSGPRRVAYFYEELVQKPASRLCRTAYRTALLELEREGEVLVLASDGRTPAPKRPARKGEMTLGEQYYVKRP
ncbi:three-Cys-motif partner protein TcmP [Nannocystis radixulma]|uniref:Three-Cys-motif partner protein TcmP n=1 Tax=Nannocystis radixulma TaxID=2995305 RepID=A0ABT5B0Y0_9BACT|nr:three-Cys-motif partner protein TcmP [Nannocystis radixulma]MDC0667118.1 three-Cys-motif partner protein TcmP [Nannocystis radixulma]